MLQRIIKLSCMLLNLSILVLLAEQSAYAQTIPIPKQLIVSSVNKKFPKEKLGFSINTPILKFIKNTQRVELCASWSVKQLKQQGDFCVDSQLIWESTKGDIVIANMNLLQLSTQDGLQLSLQVKHIINNSIPAILNGTSVYHMPEQIGKYLERIEVNENSLSLVF